MRFNPRVMLICIFMLGSKALAPQALASDLPNRSGYGNSAGGEFVQPNWRGFYLGGQLGYGFGSARNADIDGFVVGGQAGYNFQFDRAVLGVEGDIAYSGIDYRGFADTFQQKWLASARGRIGYSFERFLPYLTAGLGFTSATLKVPTGRADSDHLGFVIGIGGEALLTDKLSARVEFLHYRFGSETYSIPLATRNTSITTNTIRFGVNYHF